MVCPFVDAHLMEKIKADIVRKHGVEPAPYTIEEGSTKAPCARCGREVWVFPKHVEMVHQQQTVRPMCLDCMRDAMRGMM